MSVLDWPWSMIGAGLALVVLGIQVIVNFVRPWERRRHLASPADAYFHVRGIQDGELGYVLQDVEGHSVKEISLPPYSEQEIEVTYYPTIHFNLQETVFFCHGEDLTAKPLAKERFTRFKTTGRNRWNPEQDETLLTDYLDRKGGYHHREAAARCVGTCYTMGLVLKTQAPGIYPVTVSFLTDEVEGNGHLTIRVEERPSGRLKCVRGHGDRCHLKPMRRPIVAGSAGR